MTETNISLKAKQEAYRDDGITMLIHIGPQAIDKQQLQNEKIKCMALC